MLTLEQIIAQAAEKDASDIHLICGHPPKYRRDGVLESLECGNLDEEACSSHARALAGSGAAWREYEEAGELNRAALIAGIRCRIHLFRRQGVPSAALRILPARIPKPEELGLPPAAALLPQLRRGIVLVAGRAGSGRSTTIAAVLDHINHTRRCHIVTVEDPVEYVFVPDKAAVNQRETGKDTKDFAAGMRAAMREDPDVIMISEIPDRDTLQYVIAAAEAGYLVFAAMHAENVSDALFRLVSAFPEDMQTKVRLRLSLCLQAAAVQQLVPKTGGGCLPVNSCRQRTP